MYLTVLSIHAPSNFDGMVTVVRVTVDVFMCLVVSVCIEPFYAVSHRQIHTNTLARYIQTHYYRDSSTVTHTYTYKIHPSKFSIWVYLGVRYIQIHTNTELHFPVHTDTHLQVRRWGCNDRLHYNLSLRAPHSGNCHTVHIVCEMLLFSHQLPSELAGESWVRYLCSQDKTCHCLIPHLLVTSPRIFHLAVNHLVQVSQGANNILPRTSWTWWRSTCKRSNRCLRRQLCKMMLQNSRPDYPEGGCYFRARAKFALIQTWTRWDTS